MELAEIIGYIGAVLTTLASLPQLFRVIQTKSAEDISYLMLFIFLAGNILWTYYGFLIYSPPILVSNSLMGFVMVVIIFLKNKYRKRAVATSKTR